MNAGPNLDRPSSTKARDVLTEMGLLSAETTFGPALLAFAQSVGIPSADLPRELHTELLVEFDGSLNFRDVGGYTAAEGRRVKRGVIYRSDHLNGLTDDDRAHLRKIGVRFVHDFRLDVERERQPSRTDGLGIETVLVNMSDTREQHTAMVDLIRDALAGRQPLPPADFWETSYDDMLANGRHMFVAMFSSLTGTDRLPALHHCTAGKDRTGLATAMIHRVLGVADSDIIDDFLATNAYRTAFRLHDLRDGFAAIGIDPLDTIPVLGVTRRAIESALRTLDGRYGGATRYLIDGGLGADRLDVLRTSLLVTDVGA